MTFDDTRYKVCLRGAKHLVGTGDIPSIQAGADLIKAATKAFTKLLEGAEPGMENRILSKHCHGVLIGMKCDTEYAWNASGLGTIVGA